MATRFRDRTDAGRALARRLAEWTNHPDALILALPRGGVPVAYEIARELHLPMDVFLVRKLGVPGHVELAMGAIATGGVRVLNEDVVGPLNISRSTIDAVTASEERELARRSREYRDDRPPPGVRGMTIILVDDGLATGSTMRAAIEALRLQHPTRIIAASPVGAPAVCAEMSEIADQMVCAITPEPFHAVGLWYEDFSETTDGDVRDLLREVRVAGLGTGNAEAETNPLA
jgi:predicted phosphoribosyltransferase